MEFNAIDNFLQKHANSQSVSISFGQLLEHSLCISLTEEKYRRFLDVFRKRGVIGYDKVQWMKGCKYDSIQDALDKGVPPFIVYFPSIKQNCSVIGCSMSHIRCIELAKQNDWPYVMVFEDDALPLLNLNDDYEVKYIANGGILLLGYDIKNINMFKSTVSCLQYSPNNRMTPGYTGAYAYVVFKNAYDDFLNVAYNANPIADQISNSNAKIITYAVRPAMFSYIAYSDSMHFKRHKSHNISTMKRKFKI